MKEATLAVKKFQCIGCSLGSSVSCESFRKVRGKCISCKNHYAGTIGPGGRILLGLPPNFSKVERPCQVVRIYRTLQDIPQRLRKVLERALFYHPDLGVITLAKTKDCVIVCLENCVNSLTGNDLTELTAEEWLRIAADQTMKEVVRRIENSLIWQSNVKLNNQ